MCARHRSQKFRPLKTGGWEEVQQETYFLEQTKIREIPEAYGEHPGPKFVYLSSRN